MPNNNNNSNNRKPCKFFAQGSCFSGENCKFLHHRKDSPKNICKFYQNGFCRYGTHCKYEHVQTSWIKSATNPASSSSSTPRPTKFTAATPSATVKPEDRLLCSLAAAGDKCLNGDKCYYLHGDLCPICHKHCLHPYRVQEREEHLRICENNQKHLEALKCSQEIECSVCLDRVLSKPTAAESRFAVLPECDHPFCISCIRNWRKSSPNSAVRACPVCRKLSHFVVPSLVWYSCKEQKQEIIDNYKAKLRSIDCKHFDFGNGNCPFGINCFYKHTVKPGSYIWKYKRPPPRRPPHHRSNVADMDESLNLFEHLMEEDFLNFFDAEDFYEDMLEHLDDDDDDDEFDIYDTCDLYDEDFSPLDVTLLFSQLDPGNFSSDEEENYLY